MHFFHGAFEFIFGDKRFVAFLGSQVNDLAPMKCGLYFSAMILVS